MVSKAPLEEDLIPDDATLLLQLREMILRGTKYNDLYQLIRKTTPRSLGGTKGEHPTG